MRPGMEGVVGLVGVILLNQPLDRQACIDDDSRRRPHRRAGGDRAPVV